MLTDENIIIALKYGATIVIKWMKFYKLILHSDCIDAIAARKTSR